jgi:hypothetical protein
VALLAAEASVSVFESEPVSVRPSELHQTRTEPRETALSCACIRVAEYAIVPPVP